MFVCLRGLFVRALPKDQKILFLGKKKKSCFSKVEQVIGEKK